MKPPFVPPADCLTALDLARDLSGVDARDLDDFGLTLAEFRSLALMPEEQIARMREMARRNGLDLERLGGRSEI